MNFLTTIKSSSIAKGIRTITASLFGPDDARSAEEVAPFGIDACPVPGLQALYIQTSKSTEPVFVGYINKQQLATPGEVRLYWTDANGAEVGRVWGHNDGTVEIGGTGSAGSNLNHATQFEALNTQLTAYINALNIAIGLGVTNAGGTYTPPTTPLDISLSKITKILVP